MSRSTRLALIALALVSFAAAILLGLLVFPRLPAQQLVTSPKAEVAIAQPTTPDLPQGYLPEGAALRSALQRFSTERFQRSDRERTRRDITRILESLGWVVTQQPFAVAASEQPGVNLIATRPNAPVAGSLVLGAHYDTVLGTPGADDNATGVVAALEVARSLSAAPAPADAGGRSPRPLTLVFFDLEEAGLLGSQAFVAAYPEVAGAVILEMLGFRCDQPGCQRYPPGIPTPSQTTGTFLAAVGDRPHPQLLGAFSTEASEASEAIALPVLTLAVPAEGDLAPDLLRSDHVPFWRAGIGAVMLTDTAEFRNPHYHQPSDDVSTIDIDFYRLAVQLVVARVHQLLWVL